MLRGTPAGLEFVFGGAAFDEESAEACSRLTERPDFYRGSRATAIVDGEGLPAPDAFARFVASVRERGVELHGLYGSEGAAELAEASGLEFLGAPPRPSVANFARKRAAKVESVELTESARSLAADFAGARADIAQRRARGEASVRKPKFSAPAPSAASAPIPQVQALPATLYHRGTVRGGQSLQQIGNIVVAGDVNPGAELVATGDILVFGALRGTAHAGAQGDANARVVALELAPTQLRIATSIAADERQRTPREPEVAYVEGERIAIAPYSKMGAGR